MPKLYRPVFCFLIAFGTYANAQTALNCNTAEGVAAARSQIEGTLQSVREDQKRQEAEIDRELKSRASSKKWSQERRSKLFMDILSSPKFAAFEKEKQPYTMEMMKIALSAPPSGQKNDPQHTCAVAIRLKAIVEKVKDVNVRQYAFMLGEVKSAN